MNLLVGNKLILGKWVYKLKQGLDIAQIYKTRLVAKRNDQCKGINFKENFSPMVRQGTL
jgi:hypothetical protein